MRFRYRRETLEDKKNLTQKQLEEVEQEIERIREKGLDLENIKLVPNPELDHPIWQLKVESENTDHRVYLDIENSTIVVLAIWSSAFTHSGDHHWDKLEDRL